MKWSPISASDPLAHHWRFEESRLVCGDLPIEALADLGVREGRRPRPIYQTHKWFARRFGSAFRGLLVAACTNDDEDFWAAYLGGLNLTGLHVADPFVGGGTAIAEAQRLGASCWASDVDPVAVSITRFQSRLAEVPDLSAALDDLKAAVGARILAHHRTDLANGDQGVVLHHFWVQHVACGHCGFNYDAHPHYQLAHDADRRLQWAICRDCGEVHELGADRKRFRCDHCGGQTTIAKGVSVFGVAECPACRHTERLIDVGARTNHPPAYRLFAQEYLADGVTAGRPVPNSGRNFKKACDTDIALYDSAAMALEGPSPFALPTRRIPAVDRVDDRLIRYGYRRYTDLFNARQLLHLRELAAAIGDVDEAIREPLAIAFCDHLKTNCMLTSYAFGWRRLAPLFSIRAFRHIVRPVELNPWLDGTGRGTFPNAIRRIERARAWIREPREAMPTGGFKTLVREEQPAPGPVETRARSADDLAHIPDHSLDLVLTDPPYFDNIPYSELSDFFLPWHEALGLAGPAPDGLPPERLDGRRNDLTSRDAFEERLANCLREIRRTLKPTGIVAFTYQHKTVDGWLVLGRAMARAGFETRRVLPMLGDTDAGPHKHRDCIRWDAVIVAVPSPNRIEPSEEISSAAVEWAVRTADAWSERLGSQPRLLYNAADETNLRRACYAAALSHRLNVGAVGAGVPFVELLQTADRSQEAKTASAATDQTGHRPLRADRVPTQTSA